MRYLLDTHIFLWWMSGDKRLKKDTQRLIKDSRNEIFVSVASAWEMTIKQSIGKLKLRVPVRESLELSRLTVLPISLAHVEAVEGLPPLHRDPFDRMLIAQARTEGLILITDDEKVRKYHITATK